MHAEDYARVLEEMRLANGHLFPIPVTLPVTPDDAGKLGSEIALLDSRNEIVATMVVEEVYDWDARTLSQQVFGTTDERHALLAEMDRWGK